MIKFWFQKIQITGCGSSLIQDKKIYFIAKQIQKILRKCLKLFLRI